MTKSELLQSGIRFITWGLIFLSLHLGNLILIGVIYGRDQPHGFFTTIMFLTALFSAMGFVGGSYLCIRGFFRRKTYVPPSIKYGDEG
ncbi:MAG: hypothetical protein K2Y51_06920 [Gammaproteobacteria bacterium]|nr:hypothetical protein [Gammaproteobacteria bacterium]